MPFFEVGVHQKITAGPTPFDEDISRKLYDALVKKKILRGEVRIRTWAKSIQRMRLHDNIPEDTITKVLEWYLPRIKQEFIPQAFSSNGFRKKFPLIEAAMQRSDGEHDKIEVSSLAIKICDRLFSRRWPKGSKSQVPNVVQLSLNRYKAFLSKLETVEVESSSVRRLAEHFKSSLPSPASFVETWMLEVNNSIANWDDWNGELKSLAFKVSSKRFLRYGYNVATKYCGNSERFTKLMGALGYED